MTAPRLLTEQAAAAYLSLPLAAVQRLPIGRVTVDGRVRFDRVAIDRWLDGDAQPSLPASANTNATPAAEAIARFKQSYPDVARRTPG